MLCMWEGPFEHQHITGSVPSAAFVEKTFKLSYIVQGTARHGAGRGTRNRRGEQPHHRTPVTSPSCPTLSLGRRTKFFIVVSSKRRSQKRDEGRNHLVGLTSDAKQLVRCKPNPNMPTCTTGKVYPFGTAAANYVRPRSCCHSLKACPHGCMRAGGSGHTLAHKAWGT